MTIPRIILLFVLGIRMAPAQNLSLPAGALSSQEALGRSMPEMARRLLATLPAGDPLQSLSNRFQLELDAGDYEKAVQTILELRTLRRRSLPLRADWMDVQFEIYARAKVVEAGNNLPFPQAYARAFQQVFGELTDRSAALAIRTLEEVNVAALQQGLENDLETHASAAELSLPDALKLSRDYAIALVYRESAGLAKPLIAADDQNRYLIDTDVQVAVAPGATVCSLIVRPRKGAPRLPSLLQFTIYADSMRNLADARRTAAAGYAGVIGLTRGKACSPGAPHPYLYDGADAGALIEWISRQPWSDGRVGMYGGSYSGFTPWATAKHTPRALKAILVGAPAAPAIDVPMEGNVVWNFLYPWPFYTTNVKVLDDNTYNDNARWQRLNRDWYSSGRAYRQLDKLDGTENPIFDEWISHSSYDHYWQEMIPDGDEFARIKIPVLQTAGYFFGGPGAAVYYLQNHYAHNPQAEHYLVIGPYDHFGAQRGTIALFGGDIDTVGGYKMDPVAKSDLTDLRYEWFNYIFKGAAKPSLLMDKINYEVTGANLWKHAPSLDAMSSVRMRLYLAAQDSSKSYSLSPEQSRTSIPLLVDLADRSDIDRPPQGGGVLGRSIDVSNGLEFIGDALPAAREMSGLFSGHLEFTTNKKDFDFELDLYELTPAGEYMQLAPYWARASYVRDRSRRQLLTPGDREQLDFRAMRLMSRQLQQGSRVVLVLRVIKEPGRQINYGTGKDVSDETIKDAGPPLDIKWYGSSYIDLPLRQ